MEKLQVLITIRITGIPQTYIRIKGKLWLSNILLSVKNYNVMLKLWWKVITILEPDISDSVVYTINYFKEYF
jgi:hypothetical protein